MHFQTLPVQKTSNELFLRARDLLPARSRMAEDVALDQLPKYLDRGKGCHVWDPDGNEYIDLIMGNGQITLGYGYDVVDQAIEEQLRHGIHFSLMHPLELEVAEIIRDLVPGAEAVWFGKSDVDVRTATVRLAQAATGRPKILCCSDHSHHWYSPGSVRCSGCVSTFSFNDIQSLEKLLDESVACVILEPVQYENPHDDFLQHARELCAKNGSLLIFDEFWTGFRIALGGAQAYFGVIADVVCFSNAIANGMMLSALAGRRSVMRFMEKDTFSCHAFSGDVLPMAAAEATLNELCKRDIPQHIAHWNRALLDGYNRIAHELDIPYTRCIGLSYRTMIAFDASVADTTEMKTLVQLELLRRGVLWNGFHNLSASHKYKDISHILSAYAEALSVLKCAVDAKQVHRLIQSR